MNVLFDNCTSPVFAATLVGFLHSSGDGRAYHIRDVPGLPRGRDSTDMEWISYLQSQRDWIFISGDGRVLKNTAERAALRSASLHGFILARAYQKTPIHQAASIIIWKWPEILQVTKLLQPPSMHEIPIPKLGRLRQSPCSISGEIALASARFSAPRR